MIGGLIHAIECSATGEQIVAPRRHIARSMRSQGLALPRQNAVGERDVEIGALSASAASDESPQDGCHRLHGAGIIGDHRIGHVRLVDTAAQPQLSCGGNVIDIVPARQPERTVLPVTGQCAVHEPRVDVPQTLMAEAKLAQDAWPITFHQHISVHDQTFERCLPFGTFEIKHDDPLSGIDQGVIRARPPRIRDRVQVTHRIALRWFNLDHVGAHIGEHLHRKWARQKLAQVEYPNTIQKVCRHHDFPVLRFNKFPHPRGGYQGIVRFGRKRGINVIVPNPFCNKDVAMKNQLIQKRIGILIFERCQIVDATGAAGVFGSANEILKAAGRKTPYYDLRFVAPTTGRIVTSAGVSLFADHALSSRLVAFDTFICAGGKGTQAFIENAKAVTAVSRIAAHAARVVSVCTGAFVLAKAGVLNGRRAVTHWAYCERLATDYPEVSVDADPIFIKDGHIFTSAGVTAGMDLALALVEADLGRDVALTVARDMVMFFKRPGSQAQFSTHLAAQMAPAGSIRDLQIWLLDNLGRDIDVERLAERTAMSPRTFYRQFKKSTGMTPARFLAHSRLDAARRLVEESPLQIKAIAAECGFGDVERMRRAFQRDFGISPDDYRRRFATASTH